MSITILHNLLAGAAEGDNGSFEKLFHLYKQRVYAYAMHFTRSVTISEEIVQDVFLKLWLHKEDLKEIERLEAYLYTVTRNLCFDHLKKLASERAMKRAWALTAGTSEESAETAVIYNNYKDLVYQAVEQLPPQQKKIYALSFYEGLRHQNIAENLHISHNTVKAHLAKARAAVRRYMEMRLGMIILLLTAFVFHQW